jgi:putative phosphoribosyl transferase
MQRFRNRQDAGRRLAAALAEYTQRPATLVLALPRGGVPVAHEVAQELRLPLDVWIVRKLGVPGHEELAMGAIALGDQQFLDEALLAYLRIPEAAVQEVLARETLELQRRNRLYRDGRPLPQLADRSVILIDDGLATGASMRVAVEALRHAGAHEIIVAVPVGPADTCRELAALADRVVCVEQPEPFRGVGLWYEDFTQTSDAEVKALLAAQPWLERQRVGART